MLAARELRAFTQPDPEATQRSRRVRPRVKARPRVVSRPACVGLVLVTVLCAFTVAHRQSTLVRLGYEAERLAAQLAVLQKQSSEHGVQVAGMGSLRRVQAIAESRLGMIRPESSAVLVTSALLPPATGAPQLASAPVEQDEQGSTGALGRLWRLFLRLTSNPVEAARAGT